MSSKTFAILPHSRISGRPRLMMSFVDLFTGKAPFGGIRVFLKETNTETVKNPSGYYLFFKVPHDVVHIRVESAYYFALEKEVHIPELDPKHPVETLCLQPRPCYPFPSRTTLFRGNVTDSRGNLIPGADVRIEGTALHTTTNVRGEFACWAGVLREEDIALKGGKRFLKGGGDQTVSLRVTYGQMSGRAELKDVPEGRVTLLKSPVILNKT